MLNEHETKAVKERSLMNEIINEKHLDQTISIRNDFENAFPFKHCLMKDFLNRSFLDAILSEFPEPPDLKDLRNEFGGGSRKHSVHDIRPLGPAFRKWDDFLKSQRFLNWLSDITGIPDLLYDPEYHGGGTHNNMDGQGMDTHVDFNLHRTTGYHRRLNLIVYLNEGWQESWGGSIELHKNPWDGEHDEWVSYLPLLNHAVLFETNEYSWHGFEPVRLPEGIAFVSRKSLPVYYYTTERPEEEIAPKHGTIYVQKPMPQHIQPNTILSQKDYDSIQANFKKRNAYLKGLYTRESQLLTKIDNLEHLLKMYRETLTILSTGMVIQQACTGIDPSFKIKDRFEVVYKTVEDVNNFYVEGFVPDFVNDGINTLHLFLDDTLVTTQTVTKRFRIDVDAERETGKTMTIRVEAEHAQSPYSQGKSQDKRAFSFILMGLHFR